MSDISINVIEESIAVEIEGGVPGLDGNGIESIVTTPDEGGTTVTINFTSAGMDPVSFNVSNGIDGVSITSVSKVETVGLVDKYEIVYSSGSRDYFYVTNGKDGAINGLNSVTIAEGTGVDVTQVDSTITISAPDSHAPHSDDQDLSGLVPKTTTVNGKALNGNISLDYSDVGASASDHTHTDLHTHANKTALDNVSGTNTGDETNATIKAKLGTDLTNLQTKAITDAGGYFGTDTVEGALAELGKLITPIYTYTHSANTVVAVSAVDTTTDTLTSVGHGLTNGQYIYPVINADAGNVYPVNVMIGGLPPLSDASAKYYVINKTADTFQLSATSGGAAIDLTTNANLDLTKFHFEKIPASGMSITNLPAHKKYLVRLCGINLVKDTGKYILPNNISVATEFLHNADTQFTYPSIMWGGNVWAYSDVLIDYTDTLTIKYKGTKMQSNTTSANTMTSVDGFLVSPKYRAADITRIDFTNAYMTNGFKVEVYKI